MKKIIVQDLKPGLVQGVEASLPGEQPDVYCESYFNWAPSSLVTNMSSNKISGGVLTAWHHTPVFTEVETHVDSEMFFFNSGIALMLFMDIKDGIPDMNSAQIVRIQPGTQLIITAGKAHFVPVAESESPVNIIVVSPKMDAPRLTLSESLGV